MSELRSRIRQCLEAKGWTMRRASLEAGLSETALRDILSNPDQSPRLATIEQLAFALDADPSWLAYGIEPAGPAPRGSKPELEVTPKGFGMARVDGAVQAGAFLQVELFDDEVGEVISAPRDPEFPYARQIAYKVLGDSMNDLRPRPIREGDFAVCVAFADTGLEPKTGMVVVVQQTLNGGQLRERSLKQIEMKGDRVEFHPRSTNPAHKPIVVPFDRDPNDGREVEIISLLRFIFDNVPVQYG